MDGYRDADQRDGDERPAEGVKVGHPIAFGNFAQGYVIVDRHGIRIVRDEVSVKGTILLDTYKRVGGGLGDSNAIKWLKVATS